MDRLNTCSICHETFRAPEFAARCEAQGLPFMPYQLGDVLRTTKEAGRLATVVELRVHHGLGKCPIDGPCEHAVTYQLSLLYPTYHGKSRVWIACLGRLSHGYLPDGDRIATLTRPSDLSWGVINENGPADLYCTGGNLWEEWEELWKGFPAKYKGVPRRTDQ